MADSQQRITARLLCLMSMLCNVLLCPVLAEIQTIFLRTQMTQYNTISRNTVIRTRYRTLIGTIIWKWWVRRFDLHRSKLKTNQFLADNVAYICKLDAYKGKPSVHKCLKLDLPLGSMKKLTNNESISLPDGRIITSNDVLDFTDDEKEFLGEYCLRTFVPALSTLFRFRLIRY